MNGPVLLTEDRRFKGANLLHLKFHPPLHTTCIIDLLYTWVDLYAFNLFCPVMISISLLICDRDNLRLPLLLSLSG